MVELNHCWVQLTQCWVNILQFISASTFLHTPGLSINHKTTQPPTPFYILSCCNSAAQLPFGFTWSLAPLWRSLSTFPFYIPYLLNRSIAAGLPTGHKTTPLMTNPLFSLPLPHISHLLIVTPSLQYFFTSSLLPLSPHQSQDNPPND